MDFSPAPSAWRARRMKNYIWLLLLAVLAAWACSLVGTFLGPHPADGSDFSSEAGAAGIYWHVLQHIPIKQNAVAGVLRQLQQAVSSTQHSAAGTAEPGWTWDWHSILALFLSTLNSLISAATGQGGAPILIPLFSALMFLPTNRAVAVATFVVFLGAIPSLYHAMTMKHPYNPSTTLIDYTFLSLITPPMLLGIKAGVIVNTIAPQWFISWLLIAVYSYSTFQQVAGTARLWRKEATINKLVNKVGAEVAALEASGLPGDEPDPNTLAELQHDIQELAYLTEEVAQQEARTLPPQTLERTNTYTIRSALDSLWQSPSNEHHHLLTGGSCGTAGIAAVYSSAASSLKSVGTSSRRKLVHVGSMPKDGPHSAQVSDSHAQALAASGSLPVHSSGAFHHMERIPETNGSSTTSAAAVGVAAPTAQAAPGQQQLTLDSSGSICSSKCNRPGSFIVSGSLMRTLGGTFTRGTATATTLAAAAGAGGALTTLSAAPNNSASLALSSSHHSMSLHHSSSMPHHSRSLGDSSRRSRSLGPEKRGGDTTATCSNDRPGLSRSNTFRALAESLKPPAASSVLVETDRQQLVQLARVLAHAPSLTHRFNRLRSSPSSRHEVLMQLVSGGMSDQAQAGLLSGTLSGPVRSPSLKMCGSFNVPAITRASSKHSLSIPSDDEGEQDVEEGRTAAAAAGIGSSAAGKQDRSSCGGKARQQLQQLRKLLTWAHLKHAVGDVVAGGRSWWAQQPKLLFLHVLLTYVLYAAACGALALVKRCGLGWYLVNAAFVAASVALTVFGTWLHWPSPGKAKLDQLQGELTDAAAVAAVASPCGAAPGQPEQQPMAHNSPQGLPRVRSAATAAAAAASAPALSAAAVTPQDSKLASHASSDTAAAADAHTTVQELFDSSSPFLTTMITAKNCAALESSMSVLVEAGSEDQGTAADSAATSAADGSSKSAAAARVIVVESPYFEIVWTRARLLYFPPLMIVVGALSGLLGASPNSIFLAPMLLSLGCHPQVSSATLKLALFVSSSTSALGFLMHNQINISIGLAFGIANLLTTPIGQLVMDIMVKKSGQSSLILVAGVTRNLAAIPLLVWFNGVPSAINLAHGTDVNFEPSGICVSHH